MMTTHTLERRAPARRSPQEQRRITLLRNYSHRIPTSVFVELFGISGHLVRRYRRVAKPKHASMREDSFARTRTLPELKLLTEDERAVVVRRWTSLRANYARNPRTQRLRQLVRLCHGIVPTAVIAELSNVTAGAVVAHQRDLGLTMAAGASASLTREFLEGVAPPTVDGLTPVERGQLDSIWRRMRKDSGTDTRAREDELLRSLNARIPSVVFAAMFGISGSAITARRRELNLPRIDTTTVLRRFLALEAAPRINGLTTAEQAVVTRVWREERARVQQERRSRFDRRTKLLVRRLNAAARTQRGPKFNCQAKGCNRRFPRSATFFDRDRHSDDGLSTTCKVCEYTRKTAALLRGRVREAGRILSAEERTRVIEVLQQTSIPSRFLLRLFKMNRNHLMRLREDAGVAVTTAESWRCYLRWVAAEEMPEQPALRPGEADTLRAIWREAKEEYSRTIAEDDGRLGLQLEELRRVTARGGTPELIVCWGPYCKGERSWPKGKECMRRLTRLGEREARCHACSNMEKRMRVADAQRSG